MDEKRDCTYQVGSWTRTHGKRWRNDIGNDEKKKRRMKFGIALAQSQSGRKKFAHLGKSLPAGRASGCAHLPHSPLRGPKAASKFRTARWGPECVMGEVDTCYLVRRVREA